MRRVLFSLCVFFLATPLVSAAEELLPPFGLRWNAPTTYVEKVLKSANARIIARDKKENREVWTVEGLTQPGLKRSLFTFKEQSLCGIEVQYEYPDWTIERYNSRMGDIRRYFEGKFGPGKLVTRMNDNDTDVIQTLVGYRWEIEDKVLELFYFSAQKPSEVYRVISMSYKAL